MELAAALDKPSSSDQEIRDRVEAAIAASNAIERRTTQYLLTIRQHLSSDQQKQLFGLAAQEVRRGAGGGPGAGAGGGGGGGWRLGRHGQQGRGNNPRPPSTSQPRITGSGC